MQEAQRRYAEKIQRENPRAEVMEVTHEFKHEPWKAYDLTVIFDDIVRRIFSDFHPDQADFVVRKSLLQTPSILCFQRDHPRLYYVVTDRSLMANATYRSTLSQMLRVRKEIEAGRLPDDERGEAAGVEAIVSSLLPSQKTVEARGSKASGPGDTPSLESPLVEDEPKGVDTQD